MEQHNQQNSGMVFKRIALITLVVFLILCGFIVGMYVSGRNEVLKDLAKKEAVYLGDVIGKYNVNSGRLSQDIDFGLFWEVWDVLKRDYVDKDKLNEKEMFYGALKGLVDSAGDPYTVFMDPKLAQEFEDDLAGTFEGIGAEIGIRNEILTIISPLDGAPAQKAGLRAGDMVYAIDGESTVGISIDQAVRKIRGPKGTDVTLSISSDGISEVRDVIITRGTIVVKSVSTELRDNGIFLIEVDNFNDDTSRLFDKAVKEILLANPRGIILDLRNNPGGYLDTAIEMASEWIEDGIIVSEQFSEQEKNDFLARGRARLQEYKTVVLVNQGSASASEIVAGALQDRGKATIIGMKTFGKGSVQTLEEFKDGSSVKITVAKWLTPNGNYINEEGVSPNIEIDLTREDYDNNLDPQMDKAIEFINN